MATVVADDGCRLWTQTRGDGPELVMCHGGPGLWDPFALVTPMFADVATVTRWDQRGCGRSDVQGPYSLERFVADLEGLRSVDQWFVAGHSWGATLALEYALTHPDRVLGLVYISGTGFDWPSHRYGYRAECDRRLGPERVQRRQALKAIADRSAAQERELCTLSWRTDFADDERASWWVDVILRDGFHVNYECNRALADEPDRDPAVWAAQCRALEIPALVIHGAADPRPIAAVRPVVEALPNAKLVELPGAGHYSWLETPAAFRTAVREFLSGSR